MPSDLQGVDPTRLIILMTLGGIFALAGLYLLVRPHPSAGETRIEFLGLKFNASSAGTVVFLIGAVFLAVPVFVPERGGSDGSPSSRAWKTNSGTAVVNYGSGGPSQGAAAIILPPKADATEQESNDSMHEANQISRGYFYAGALDERKNDRDDWFVVPTSDLINTDMKIQVRTIEEGSCWVSALNDKEEKIEENRFGDRGASGYQEVFVGDTNYIMINIHSSSRCRYELKVH